MRAVKFQASSSQTCRPKKKLSPVYYMWFTYAFKKRQKINKHNWKSLAKITKPLLPEILWSFITGKFRRWRIFSLTRRFRKQYVAYFLDDRWEVILTPKRESVKVEKSVKFYMIPFAIFLTLYIMVENCSFLRFISLPSACQCSDSR